MPAAPKWVDMNGRMFALNPILLERQKIDSETYDLLIETHRFKFDLLDLMGCLDPYQNTAELKGLANIIDRLEYIQQALWGFPLDPDFHMFWIVPHCTCPKTANEYLWGVPGRVVSTECPIHSEDPVGEADGRPPD